MSNTQNKRVLALMRLPENSLCADCHAKDPRWASSKLGVFICINCSGIHRGLGTHITFVRSCTLDTWKPEEVDVMERVGNRKANEYWEERLPPDFVRPHSDDMEAMGKFLRQKYELKKWVDPLKRPPQIPDDVPWEPEPQQSYSMQPSNDNNQIPGEPPRRRRKKKTIVNQAFNDSTDTFNDNNSNPNFQDTNSPYSSSYTEAKNKMKNNKKKISSSSNNIPIEHENANPSSDSLMSNDVPYNPSINTNNNISDEDNGFDPFSGKPLSKDYNHDSDEDTHNNDNTIADKIKGFIQNGIDFIKEKTKKRNNVPNSSGKMSDNPRIPKQESFDTLQSQNSNRPQFSSFEQQQQFYRQQSQRPPQETPYRPNHQQQTQYQQSDNQETHNDLGKRKEPPQQQGSADIFSMLDGSDIIIDDSLSGQNSNEMLTQNEFNSPPSLSTTQNSQNPFLNEIAKDSSQPQNQAKNDFNPFTNQSINNGSPNNQNSTGILSNNNNQDLLSLSMPQSSTQEQDNSMLISNTSNDADNLLGLPPQSNSQQPEQQGSANISQDLFDISSPNDLQPSKQQGSANSTSAATDLFDLSIPSNLQANQQQQGSNNSVPVNSDLFDLSVSPSPQKGSADTTGRYASDLFDLSVPSAPDTNQSNLTQNQSSSPEPKIKSPSAYDVFGRQGTTSSNGTFGASPAGSNLGSLGLSPQQQQIAMRALHSQQRSSQGFSSPGMRQGSGNVFNYGSTSSQNNINTSPASTSKSGNGKQQSSNDPFFGMNPF